jgi:hypothetical protein
VGKFWPDDLGMEEKKVICLAVAVGRSRPEKYVKADEQEEKDIMEVCCVVLEPTRHCNMNNPEVGVVECRRLGMAVFVEGCHEFWNVEKTCCDLQFRQQSVDLELI